MNGIIGEPPAPKWLWVVPIVILIVAVVFVAYLSV